MMSGMVEHMDAYYLRRILKRYLVLPIFQGCTLIYTGAQLTLLSISCLFGVQSDLKVDWQRNGTQTSILICFLWSLLGSNLLHCWFTTENTLVWMLPFPYACEFRCYLLRMSNYLVPVWWSTKYVLMDKLFKLWWCCVEFNYVDDIYVMMLKF